MNQKGNTTINIIIAIIIMAFVVGGAVYYSQNQKDVITEQTKPVTNITVSIIDENTKKYTDNQHNFLFIFPATYIHDEIRGINGLWHSNLYERQKRASEDQMVIADIEIKGEPLNNRPLEQYISDSQDFIGMNPGDYGDLDKRTPLGDNEFIILNVSEYLDFTFYFTQHEDVVVSFITHWFEDEEDERYKDIIQIISTLQFQ